MSLVGLVALLAPALAAPGDPWVDVPSDVGASPDSVAVLSQDQFAVGEDATIEYVVVVGPGGLGPGDLIRVEDPLFHGIRFSKWGAPFDDPGRCGSPDGHVAPGSFVSVTAVGGGTVVGRRSTNIAEIHDYAYTEVEVTAGQLVQGDEVVVTYGDLTAGPNCGQRMPYRAFRSVPWRAYELRGDGTQWQAIAPPTFDVVSLDEVAALRAIAPSTVGSGERFRLKVTAFDLRGNPVESWTARVEVAGEYGGAASDVSPGDGGTVDFELAIEAPGVHRIAVAVDGVEVLSNPVVVSDVPPASRLYWGDIHTHHGHTAVDADGFLTDANHEYARDAVALDFSAESMKNPPHEIDGERLWAGFQDTCEAFTSNGAYVALMGFEWMGGPYGHHNVYFDSCAAEVPEQTAFDGLVGEGGLYAWVAEAERDLGGRAVVIPHASLYTGYDWDARDELRATAEVYSEWNSSMEPRDDAGSIPSALRVGNQFGFIAGSDNHDGWMGNPWSYRDDENQDVLSGLAAAWMPELSREAVLDALRDRTTYATSGDRIVVRYWLEDPELGEVGTGERVQAAVPSLHWEIHGTAAVEDLRVVGVAVTRDGPFTTWLSATPDALDVEGSMPLIAPPGVEQAVWLEIEQVDGERAWTTPIWVTPAGAEGSCGCGHTPWRGGALSLSLLPALVWWRRRRA